MSNLPVGYPPIIINGDSDGDWFLRTMQDLVVDITTDDGTFSAEVVGVEHIDGVQVLQYRAFVSGRPEADAPVLGVPIDDVAHIYIH